MILCHYPRKERGAQKCCCIGVGGCAGVCIFIFLPAWRERQVPFYGLWEFLGFLENARNPKYPHLQAFVEKHAIHILYYIVKNSNMDLFDG